MSFDLQERACVNRFLEVDAVEFPEDSGELLNQIELPDDSGEFPCQAELPDDSGEFPNQQKLSKNDTAELANNENIEISAISSENPSWRLDSPGRPTPQDSEKKAKEIYGGDEQRSYKDGREVPYGTLGSTRPDIVRSTSNGVLEAIEVKNYDLSNGTSQLVNELSRQISDRCENMPNGTIQRVCLDIRGQDLLPEKIEEIKNQILQATQNTCPDLKIDVISDRGVNQ